MDLSMLAGRLGGVLRLVVAGPPPVGAVVFAYHDVVNDAELATEYGVRAATFARHLDATIGAGYRFVDLGALVDMLRAGRAVDGLAAVTFDDALEGVHRNALPLLQDRRIPATVFTVAGAAPGPPPWWPGSTPVMSAAALAELVDAGISVGCHTASHPSLVSLTRSQMEAEIVGARAALEDVLGRAVDLLAYPFGHFDAEVLDVVRTAGFRAGFTFLNGRVTTGLDLLRLPRLTMGEHHSSLRLRYHLARPVSSWPDTQLDVVGRAPGLASSGH